MNIRAHIVRLASLIGIALLAYAPATYASEATTQFNVTAGVMGTCNVAMSGDLNFGTYSGARITGVATNVNLRCTKDEPVTIGMGYGLNPIAGNIRRVKFGTNYLRYRLGKNLNCTDQWGNSGTLLYSIPHATGTLEQIPVYGCMAAGQYGVTGQYQDTVTVTVNFL